MLKTIVLICSIGTPVQDCSETTAIDVVAGAPASNGSMCGLFGQAGIAPTGIAPEMGKTYQKVVCVRTGSKMSELPKNGAAVSETD